VLKLAVVSCPMLLLLPAEDAGEVVDLAAKPLVQELQREVAQQRI
jgi:hypothetical protein